MPNYVRDRPHSSLHRSVRFDVLPQDWGGDVWQGNGRFGERSR
jgi:hypothetical protein